MPEPTITAGMVRGLFEFAVSKGADPQQLHALTGLTRDDLRAPASRLPIIRYVALMRAGQKLCSDPALALHYAEGANFAAFSIVEMLTNSSETMQEAFEQIARFGRLDAQFGGANKAVRLHVEPADEGLAWIVDTRDNPNLFPEATEVTFARLACGPRVFDQTPFIREVHVTHPAPPYRSEYDRIFRAPVYFESDKNALLIEESWGARKIAPRQRYAFGVLSDHANALLDELEKTSTTRGEVETLLMPILHTGNADMTTVAGRIGISRQTLFRRLKAEGTSFERVLDDLRHKMAIGYLAGRKTTIAETSYLVGFSEPAAFIRAFRRWTGVTPNAFREQSSGAIKTL
ncbi:MAG TPA: AraC family transcriptional regulator ligand-binding domain-containing protein [Rhizomicrobium sp.]|nr:AraC family transcriptional regulator ligand-binding domain-containing protein [Rhizomicrobium sp.]